MLDRRHLLTVFSLSLVLLAGCASDRIAVSTVFDPLMPFPKQATYAWDDRASSVPEQPRFRELDTEAVLKEVADEEFAKRGYRAVSSGSPDYRLSYQVTASTFIGADSSRSTGSLSLLLVEAATNHRVWMGFGQAQIHVGLTREERKERLRDALSRMLEEFPPTQRGD